MSIVPSVRTRRNTRLLGAGAAALCAVLALAGCSGGSSGGAGALSGSGSSPGASASGGASTAPSGGTTTPSTGPATPTTHPATPPPTSHAYPSDYAGAILAAWKAHDTAYLTLLTSAATANQLYGFGNINQTWTGFPGSGAAGSTYWQFYNNAGDWLAIQTNNVKTGGHKWHAGQVGIWNKMTFPADADTYAKNFVTAWADGNVARMNLLSNATTVAAFMALPSSEKSDGFTTSASGAAGSTYVTATDSSVSLNVTVQVVNQTLGHQHAIIACQSGC